MLNKTNKYQTLLAICLLTLSACSSNESLSDSPNNQGKTPIELSVGIVGENAVVPSAQTRTVITNDSPYGNPATAFTDATSLYMVLKSEYGGTGTAQAPKYSRSIGTVPGSGGTNPLNVSFASGYQRYWEDSYSRDSKVSVYSACVPGNTSTALDIAGTDYNQNNYTWSPTTITPTIDWPLTGVSGTLASQDAAFLTNQDLCFSNNVSGDNCIAFDTSTKKFLAKKMVFHHALTKVTFKIKRGNGFGTGTEVFNFTNDNENLVLTGFNTNGTLNISTGEFSSVTTTNPITSLADTKTSADAAFDYVLTCLMLPGSALTSTATDEVYFTIDNNKYHITKSQLASALSGKTVGSNSTAALTSDSKMRPGVHYIFTMTVSKSQISNLSAAVVAWEAVTANEVTPSNARISVSLLNNGTPESGAATFDLYRSANVYEGETISDTWESYAWAKDYEKATLTYNSTTGAYEASDGTSPWYWPNNRTFYHFRTIKPQTTETWKVKLDETDSNNKFEYIELTGAPYSTTVADSYKDVCWGAPFNDTTGKLTYEPTTYGFDGSASHQISKAIGPTTSTIYMNTFHMMSDVIIKLTTTTTSDAVILSGATIELTPIYNTGTVKMGNGLITTTGSTVNVTGTVSDVDGQSYKQWRYGFVPQPLASIVLTITTTDNNQYIVNMNDLAATVGDVIIANPYTSEESGKYKINYWYPNYNYTYSFKLTKTGIEKISATLTNWGAVTADEETIVIQ